MCACLHMMSIEKGMEGYIAGVISKDAGEGNRYLEGT